MTFGSTVGKLSRLKPDKGGSSSDLRSVLERSLFKSPVEDGIAGIVLIIISDGCPSPNEQILPCLWHFWQVGFSSSHCKCKTNH